MKPDLPPQIENLLKKVRECIENRAYRMSKHAIERGIERFILPQDIRRVLTHGIHEEKKTSFDPRTLTWKYAIRGKTKDGIDIRVIVVFVEKMVIVTVIRLTKKKFGRKS